MNSYSKYCPNVFVAKCQDQHKKGDEIILKTKYGKEHECIVHNFLHEKNGFYYYSITRVDGFDYQAWCQRRAERYAGYSSNAESKADEYYKRSNKDKDFLSLAEPVKVGHHSERRHRKIIKQAQDNTTKWIEHLRKSEDYQTRVQYWSNRSNDINLSMPESIEYYEIRLSKAMEYHKLMKETPKNERPHSYSLTYAKKEVNNMQKNYEMALKLWG